MKILIVTSYYSPEIGAAASRMGNLADGLTARGDEVDVLAPIPNYPLGMVFPEYLGKRYCMDEINGHRVYRYKTYTTVSKSPLARALGMISFAAKIWCFGTRRKLVNSYDLVIVQSPPLPVAYSAIKLFKTVFRKKVILNVSDLWPLSAVELGVMRKDNVSHRIFAHMERSIYHHADAIMGQSEEILEHIRLFDPKKDCFLYRNLKPESEKASKLAVR